MLMKTLKKGLLPLPFLFTIDNDHLGNPRTEMSEWRQARLGTGQVQ